VRGSVEVHNYLMERDIPHELVPSRGRLRWPKRMAAILGLRPDQVGRVVIFEAAGPPVAAVVPSGGEPDPMRLAKAVGRPSVNKVDESHASGLTEYLPESIPPVGLPEPFTVVLDESLNRDEVLYFPGGEPRSVLKIRGTDLARATGAKVAPILFHWPGE